MSVQTPIPQIPSGLIQQPSYPSQTAAMMTSPVPYGMIPAPILPPPTLPPAPKDLPPTQPSQTIYIRNLTEKIKIMDLKKTLFAIFSPYGEILAISAKKNVAMRGQAFIVFKEIDSAIKAIEELQHFPLFNKAMLLQFSRSKSDIVAKGDGSLEENRKRRAEEKATRPKREFKKTQPSTVRQQQGVQVTSKPAAPPVSKGGELPNAILFLQELPPDTTHATLHTIFHQYPGFKEVRLVPGKSDIAFVEFENELQSSYAKVALAGYKLTPERKLRITFAKK